MWPSTDTRVSSPAPSSITRFTSSAVIFSPALSTAPSATMTVLCRVPNTRLRSRETRAQHGTERRAPFGDGCGEARAPRRGVDRALRDEDPIGARGERGHERKIAAVAPHHLHHKRALMRRRRRHDRVERLHDAVQRRVRADRCVRADLPPCESRTHAESRERVPCRCRCCRRAPQCAGVGGVRRARA